MVSSLIAEGRSRSESQGHHPTMMCRLDDSSSQSQREKTLEYLCVLRYHLHHRSSLVMFCTSGQRPLLYTTKKEIGDLHDWPTRDR
jgi:hypothetical protein